MGICFEKSGAGPFLSKNRREREDGFHERSEEKRIVTGKETQPDRLGVLASCNPVDLLDEFLSDDSGIHPVIADRYGREFEL